jgi:hypothetical protein
VDVRTTLGGRFRQCGIGHHALEITAIGTTYDGVLLGKIDGITAIAKRIDSCGVA